MDPFATEGIQSPLPSPCLTSEGSVALTSPFRQKQVGKRGRREREDCTFPLPLECSLGLGAEAVGTGVSGMLKLPGSFSLLP